MSYEYKIGKRSGTICRRKLGQPIEWWNGTQAGWEVSSHNFGWDKDFVPLEVVLPTPTPAPLLTITVEPVGPKETTFEKVPVGNAFRLYNDEHMCFRHNNNYAIRDNGEFFAPTYSRHVLDLGPATCVMEGGATKITVKGVGARFEDASSLPPDTVFNLDGHAGTFVRLNSVILQFADFSNVPCVYTLEHHAKCSGTIIGKATITVGGAQ